MSESLITPNDAANFLSLSRNTLNTWRSRGRGPRYVKIGGKVFYRPADLEAFIAASVVDPTHVAA